MQRNVHIFFHFEKNNTILKKGRKEDMKTKDCMCQNIVVAHPNTSVEDCCRMMGENHVGCMPVCNEENQIVGIVTDRDIVLRGIACQKDPKQTRLSDIMTTQVCCCGATDDLEKAEKLMKENKVRRLPVVENNQVVGILTIGDLACSNNVSCECLGETLENICHGNQCNAE